MSAMRQGSRRAQSGVFLVVASFLKSSSGRRTTLSRAIIVDGVIQWANPGQWQDSR